MSKRTIILAVLSLILVIVTIYSATVDGKEENKQTEEKEPIIKKRVPDLKPGEETEEKVSKPGTEKTAKNTKQVKDAASEV